MRTVMTLIKLNRCSGLSESSLGAQVILLDLPCSSSFIFHKERNVLVNYKVCSNIFHIAKCLNVSHDFHHILSYKRALYVTIALKW